MHDRIPSLDGLRAVAIGLVILSHRALAGAVPPIVSHVLEYIQPGVIGVRLFFILSGFLITTLLIGELDRSGDISLKRFYLRRTLRLFPPLAVYIAVLLILAAAGLVRLMPGDVAHALTYASNFHLANESWYVGHTWSLSIEEQFYLLWPAALLLAKPRRARWIAVGILFAGPLIKLTMWATTPPEAQDSIASTFRSVADTLAAGCALALLRPRLHTMPAYKRALESPLLWLAPAFALVLWSALGHWRLAMGTQLISIVLFTVWIDRLATVQDAGARLLNAKPVAWLGRISYSIYLWQQLFTAPRAIDPWQSLPITSGALRYLSIFVVAVLSFYLVERPSLRLRQRVEQLFLGRTMPLASKQLAEQVAAV